MTSNDGRIDCQSDRKGTYYRSRWFTGLSGLKAICVLGVFAWHCLPVTDWFNIGARCCEVFFVVSGFLEGYKHRTDYEFTISEVVSIYAKKFRALFPLHFVTFLLGIIAAVIKGFAWGTFNKATCVAAVYNLLLLQAWVPEQRFWFNGVSWFLSALLFCYACAPFIAYLYARLQQRGGWRWVFVGVSCLVILLFCGELSAVWYPSVFTILQPHVSPVIRCLEFAIAYFVGCALSERDMVPSSPGDGPRLGIIMWTFIELVAAALVVTCMLAFNDVWPRSAFVLLFIGVVVLTASERGLVTKVVLSSRPLALITKIELPFFMSHQVIWNIVRPLTETRFPLLAAALATFVLSVAFSLCWNAAARKFPPLSGRRPLSSKG